MLFSSIIAWRIKNKYVTSRQIREKDMAKGLVYVTNNNQNNQNQNQNNQVRMVTPFDQRES